MEPGRIPLGNAHAGAERVEQVDQHAHDWFKPVGTQAKPLVAVGFHVDRFVVRDGIEPARQPALIATKEVC